MTESDFLITLPSNSNMATNPSNEPSNYTVKLADSLNLTGDWEAALVSVQYTPTWLTFKNTLNLLLAYIVDPSYDDRPDLRPHPTTVSFANLASFMKLEELLGQHGLTHGQLLRQRPSGLTIGTATLFPKYYASAAELGNAICNAMNDVTSSDKVTTRYEYDYATKKGYFIVTGAKMRVYTENYIALGELLGHRTSWVKCDKCEGCETHQRVDNTPHYFHLAFSAHKPSNLPRIHSLWVYTNITENQQVGDTKAPLLGIVPTFNTTDQRIHYTVNPIHFLAVNRSFIPEINIQIMDDRGKRVPFATGDSEDNLVCCLRFRRRKSFMPI